MGAIANLNNDYSKFKAGIEIFKENLRSRSSINTFNSYMGDLNQFFLLTKGKTLEELSYEDIVINNIDIEKFKNSLALKNISGKSINRKLSALKKFYKAMNLYEINSETLNLFKSLDREKEINVHYDAFTYDEVMKIVDNIELIDKDYWKELRWLVILAVDTGMRKTPLLELKWQDMTVRGTKEVRIYAREKGQKDNKNIISYNLYKKMKVDIGSDCEKVFPNLTKKKIETMMNWIKDYLNISENRKIVFHSFKTTAVSIVYEESKDIKAAQMKAGHSNIQTTDSYIRYSQEKEKGLFSREEVNEDLYKSCSEDILLKAIGMLDHSQLYVLNKQIQKLQNE